MEGVGAGGGACANPEEMAQKITSATFRICMKSSTVSGFYE
jgi:hypothetical protein